MKITWLGHASFRLEIEDAVILLDPWLEGNPMLPAAQHDAAIAGATHVLVTHGHSDHGADAPMICERLGIPAVGIYDLMQWWAARYDFPTIGFNKGGTVKLGRVAVTMVNASHSSASQSAGGPVYTGTESGYMIAGDGHVIYATGDTDIMADMAWMGEVHNPDIGLMCAGGYYTMDMARASYAARKYFNFRTLIPCHYRTFPALEQSAALMKEVLTGVDVIEPQVLQPIEV
ncbi:MAG: hydrolase [Rhodobacterales bacterium CG2_30_65_12]|nr:MAG: hydrolase [Rhodobacterales bacterium CG2_30_65_12]